jgi:hypothetical protein
MAPSCLLTATAMPRGHAGSLSVRIPYLFFILF